MPRSAPASCQEAGQRTRFSPAKRGKAAVLRPNRAQGLVPGEKLCAMPEEEDRQPGAQYNNEGFEDTRFDAACRPRTEIAAGQAADQNRDRGPPIDDAGKRIGE